ncbi:MAG: single-stranded DNA-binding protein [Candidatus Altimarinota bacterium]
MRSVNKVILVGNLTRDPEMRQTPNGQQVCTFGIATNRQWVSKDGSKHTSAEFHELVAWARLADICGKYLKKGKLIYVEGYLKTRAWDTPEGIRRHKTEVIVQDMIMLEKRPKDGGDDLDEISVASSENMADMDVPMPEPEPDMMDDKIEF